MDHGRDVVLPNFRIGFFALAHSSPSVTTRNLLSQLIYGTCSHDLEDSHDGAQLELVSRHVLRCDSNPVA